MNGLPPTPPSTGCLGIVIDCPAGCSDKSTTLSAVYSCVPFRLLLKVISTPNPPNAAAPLSVVRGPGLLLQSTASRSAFTLIGISRSVMLMWGRDDDEANEGASGWCEVSRQAPVNMNAPARAAACSARERARKVCRCMVRFSLFLHGDGCQSCESFRSRPRWRDRPSFRQGTCREHQRIRAVGWNCQALRVGDPQGGQLSACSNRKTPGHPTLNLAALPR